MANNSELGRRSQEVALQTRSRILDEAESLFARMGFGVSLRQIARASGVHHHTVQHHFTNKKALFEAVLTRWDDEIQATLVAATQGLTDIEDFIDVGIDTVFEFLLEKRNWVIVTTMAATGLTREEGIYLKQDSWLSFINGDTTRISLGKDVDAGLFMMTIGGILHYHILVQEHYLAIYGKTLDDEETRAQTLEHIKGIIHSIIKI